MSLPIRTLPIVEQWDCHGCGLCCRGTIINLRDDDLARIRSQHWEEHPEYRGVKILTRHGLFKAKYRLAKRSNGSCVFLTPRRCRIHELHGAEAKPLVCQLFPLQIVPLEKFAYLTLRRFCPSAAADRGRNVEEHCRSARDLLEWWGAGPKPVRPPRIGRGRRGSWKLTMAVADAFTRLLLDALSARAPDRTWSAALRLVGAVPLRQNSRPASVRVTQLIGAVIGGGGERSVSQSHRPASVRWHFFGRPCWNTFPCTPSSRRRTLGANVGGCLCGRGVLAGEGKIPALNLPFPKATFESLERSLGPLPEEVLKPLDTFFQTATASLRYAVMDRPGWPLVESFRALALSHAIALWTLRLTCGDRPPAVNDVIRAVMMLDRGLTFDSLLGRRHQIRVGGLARRSELAHLVVWYAR